MYYKSCKVKIAFKFNDGSYITRVKGRGHGNFHNAFMVPMFSLGDTETQSNILKVFKIATSGKISCQNVPNFAL